MMGPAVGRAYVPHRGMGTVFADGTAGAKCLTVQLDRTGARLFISRERIQWRRHG